MADQERLLPMCHVQSVSMFVGILLCKENVPEIMDWPSNSPDLNPIENLWAIVKRETERRMPKNLNELERIMVEEWNAIPVSVLINLVDSMKRRCEEVIVKNGERISY